MVYGRGDDAVRILLGKVKITQLASDLGYNIKYQGDRAKCLCPFHEDHRPSLNLYEINNINDRPYFHCFACGAHGDIFHLVQREQGMPFREALQWLAERYDVPLKNVQRLDKKQKVLDEEVGDNEAGLEKALEIYLNDKSRESSVSDFAAEREFTEDFLLNSELSVSRPKILINEIVNREDRYLLADLESAKLIKSPREKSLNKAYWLGLNDYLEFFKEERIIFPIRSDIGKLVGFAGRKLSSSITDAPKYLYTPGFRRQEALYRSNVAFRNLEKKAKQLRSKPENRERKVYLYLVEGFLDALRLESLGIPSVAILGASLTNGQVELIRKISETLLDRYKIELSCHVFLDRDTAGIRGSAGALSKLLNKLIISDYVYPLTSNEKDPDDILKKIAKNEAEKLLNEALYPPSLALLAEEIGEIPKTLLSLTDWNIFGPQWLQKVAYDLRARFSTLKDSDALQVLFNQSNGSNYKPSWCLEQLKKYLLTAPTAHQEVSAAFLENEFARLDHARQLAYSSVQRGELPVDVLSWRRIFRVSPLFNRGLVQALRRKSNLPIEPYDAVKVPRNFESEEPRVKAMPCPEDLILQQYMLMELLSERYGQSYSSRVPAVRYFKNGAGAKTRTTGEEPKSTTSKYEQETMCFSYQIDMEVVEGLSIPGESGIFRHYWNCWQDFINQLKRRTSTFEGDVHCIRLDLKRYYDTIQRGWMRDALISRVSGAFDCLNESVTPFKLYFEASTDVGSRAHQVVDWLIDQSFDYKYYSPETGEVDFQAVPPDKGIPQGPDLSAYLATIALFPVDNRMRKLLNKINGNSGSRKAVYARYVDDIVLAADSPELLTELRESFEDALRGSNQTALNKHGRVPTMTADKFADFLTDNRAFSASMPVPGFVIDGDGAALFDSELPQNRSQAQVVLNDSRLFLASKEAVINAIHEAMAVPEELRQREISKAARWVWYVISEELVGNEIEVCNQLDVKRLYFLYWNKLFWNLEFWPKDISKKPWCDPVLFALEGLDLILSDRHRFRKEFDAAQQGLIASRLKILAKLVKRRDFPTLFERSEDGLEYPDGWGEGLPKKLTRMYVNRVAGLRGKAFDLLNEKIDGWEPDLPSYINKASLIRNYINNITLTGTDTVLSSARPDRAPHYEFSLINEVLSYLRAGLEIPNTYSDLINTSSSSDGWSESILKTIKLWIEDDNNAGNGDKGFALKTLLMATESNSSLKVLSSCRHLLECITGGGDEQMRVLTPIPIDTTNNETEGALYIFQSGYLHSVSLSDKADANDIFFNLNWSPTQKKDGLYCKSFPVSVEKTDLKRAYQDAEPYHLILLVQCLEQCVEIYINDNKSNISSSSYAIERPIHAGNILRNTETKEWQIIAEPIDAELLGNQAFTRDGTMGLRSVSVPLIDSWLWRIGVALTDYFGFADDYQLNLDRDGECSDDKSPAWYMLRRALERLRGFLLEKRLGRFSKDERKIPRVPGWVERLIKQLKQFAEAPDNKQAQAAFVYSMLFENSAMYEKIEKYRDFSRLGAITEFCQTVFEGFIQYKLTPDLAAWMPAVDSNNFQRSPVNFSLALFKQLCSLPSPENKEGQEELSWQALIVSSEISVVSIVARLLTIDLAVVGVGIDLEEPDLGWELETYFINYSSDDHGNRDLLSYFEYCISNNLNHMYLKKISVFGWLALLKSYLKSIREHGDSEILYNLEKKQEKNSKWDGISTCLDKIDQQIRKNLKSEDKDCWPYDDGVCEWITDSYSKKGELVRHAIELLTSIDHVFSFTIVERKEVKFQYNAKDELYENSYKMPLWKFTIYGNRNNPQPESVIIGDKYYYVWTEVWSGKNLISISCVDKIRAKTRIKNNGGEHFEEVGATHKPSVPKNPSKNINVDEEDVQKVKKKDEDCSEKNKKPKPKIDNTIDETRGIKEFRDYQVDGWKQRTKTNARNVRVALFQWDVDDSYRHPAVDVGVTPSVKKRLNLIPGMDKLIAPPADFKPGEEVNIDKFLEENSERENYFESWNEHRRQKLIKNVVQACSHFKVDVLVLPEYSVRPETIIALKEYLANTPNAPSIYAGTFRMYGAGHANRGDQLNGIPSLSEDRNLEAILCLIEANESKPKVYRRSKRYPSVSAGEFFKPSGSELPLNLVRKSDKKNDLLDYFVELICSEIFIATSPSNILFLASEYIKLLKSFGSGNSIEEKERTIKDIQEYALKTSLFVPISEMDASDPIRKSILVVPSMSSRSADYWVFGQSAMLAAGMTTVFCNAVWDKYSVGGSCFIGKDSWKNSKNNGVGLYEPTPYHGWSHGICYSGHNGPLSNKDQALVIADIDPVHMMEGKPRPQSLGNPLQLVAYLPIIEVLVGELQDGDNGRRYYPRNMVNETLMQLNSEIRSSLKENRTGVKGEGIFPDQSQGITEHLYELSKYSSDCFNVNNRISAWQDNFREQPMFGKYPPVITDWITVDLSPQSEGLPKIFVPPWASKTDLSKLE